MPGEKISTTTTDVPVVRKVEFPETSDFEQRQVNRPAALAVGEWKAALRSTEISDHQQKIRARPYFAWGVSALVVVQTLAIFIIVFVALIMNKLEGLQLIFSALIAGTLTQSYFLLRLITEKVFGDIDYHNGDSAQS